MRVLFQTRTNVLSVPGGDTVQLERTAKYLRLSGVEVDLDLTRSKDVSAYDLVHLFNLTRPQDLYVPAIRAKEAGKPVVLSTIYVDYSEYERRARGGMSGSLSRILPRWEVERIKVVARAVISGEALTGSAHVAFRGYRAMCHRVLELTDVLMPNSTSELQRICLDFPDVADRPCVIVPNAVDTDIFDYEGTEVSGDARALEGCVLSVARIEGLKCQRELILAMQHLPYQLLLIGRPAPHHQSYFNAIMREAKRNVHVLSHVAHEDLPKYYKAAKVHALVSWMETTGLSSLEAGAMGCNLVITAKGDTREYFADDAVYCEPDSVSSIRDAITRAYAAPSNRALRERIVKHFNWRVAADRTLEGYQRALAITRGSAVR